MKYYGINDKLHLVVKIIHNSRRCNIFYNYIYKINSAYICGYKSYVNNLLILRLQYINDKLKMNNKIYNYPITIDKMH